MVHWNRCLLPPSRINARCTQCGGNDPPIGSDVRQAEDGEKQENQGEDLGYPSHFLRLGALDDRSCNKQDSGCSERDGQHLCALLAMPRLAVSAAHGPRTTKEWSKREKREHHRQ